MCCGLALATLLAVVASRAEDRPRDFAPGVRIDWPKLTVELDAEVVMRQGPLELVACSPQTKEHESILRVAARPTHIFQAMGLVGLTPGSPVRYVEKENRSAPPTGDRLDIRIRYTDDQGRTIFTSPAEWLTPTKPQATPLSLPFVFAGSYTLPDGRFVADIEGTVLCLVDFEAALIALPALHSADNEELWLNANANTIPPKGTKCTLMIRGLYRPPIRLDLAADGSLWLGDRALDMAAIADSLKAPPDDDRPPHVRICRSEGPPDAAGEKTMKAITEAAGPNARIESQTAPCRFEEGAARTQSRPD